MATIVNGKHISQLILKTLRARVQSLQKRRVKPAFAVVIVGNDGPSKVYVRKKEEQSNLIGLSFLRFEISASISTVSLCKQLRHIQATKQLSGLIIQLPLPKQLASKTQEILNAINPDLDVDFLTEASMGKLALGTNTLQPPTASAVMEVLRTYNIKLVGKHIVIVGRGNLVGKPLANIFLNEPVTLTVCGSKTKNLTWYTKQADILISGVGKPKLITGDMIKKGAIVIDAGTSSTAGTLVGDIDFESVSRRSSLITPTPGGVGPITVAKLLENVVANAERALQQD